MIHHTYPDWVVDQGKNWARDRFYYGLAPSLSDALEFMMVELPEREDGGMSADTHTHQGQGSSDAYQDRYKRYLVPTGWVATLTKEELILNL